MRRVKREPLTADVQESLDHRQAEANRKQAAAVLDVDAEWKAARQSAALRIVVAVLKRMMGEHERCMYCLDSHGTDIEHYWPKAPYPERLFVWPNLLLCCAECGRLKGDRFPLAAGRPLLVDPTAEEPWMYLDFDPTTGNVVARFDLATNDWSPRGRQTVDILQLDRREALAASYRRTFRRLSAVVERYLSGDEPDAEALATALREVDDHGLLGWCFIGTSNSKCSAYSTTRSTENTKKRQIRRKLAASLRSL